MDNKDINNDLLTIKRTKQKGKGHKIIYANYKNTNKPISVTAQKNVFIVNFRQDRKFSKKTEHEIDMTRKPILEFTKAKDEVLIHIFFAEGNLDSETEYNADEDSEDSKDDVIEHTQNDKVNLNEEDTVNGNIIESSIYDSGEGVKISTNLFDPEVRILKHVKNNFSLQGDHAEYTIAVKKIVREMVKVDLTKDKATIRFSTRDPDFLKKENATQDTIFEYVHSFEYIINPNKCHHTINEKSIVITLKVESSKDTNWKSQKKVATVPPITMEQNKNSSDFHENFIKTRNIEGNNVLKNNLSILPHNNRSKMRDREYQPGFTGLRNIGNTCYFNSILQILVNTQELRDYFSSRLYIKEINKTNKLGYNGELAKEFANLTENMWSGDLSVYSPNKIKSVLEKKSSQFRGLGQHDAHELFSCLVDGLHEDLNTIEHKPYIEIPDFDPSKTTEKDYGDLTWKMYCKRNRSHISKLFCGQYKSKLTCLTCRKVSIVFDPFSSLSLPLPEEKSAAVFTVFFKDLTRKPTNYKLGIKPGVSIMKLKENLSDLTDILPENMDIFKVNKDECRVEECERNGYFQHFNCSDHNYSVFEKYCERDTRKEMVQIRVSQVLECPNSHLNSCTFCNSTPSKSPRRCEGCFKVAYCNSDCQRKHWEKRHRQECYLGSPIAVPLVINIPKSEATFKKISNLILKYAQYSVDVIDRNTNNDILSNFSSNKSSSITSSEDSNDSNSDWKNSPKRSSSSNGDSDSGSSYSTENSPSPIRNYDSINKRKLFSLHQMDTISRVLSSIWKKTLIEEPENDSPLTLDPITKVTVLWRKSKEYLIKQKERLDSQDHRSMKDCHTNDIYSCLKLFMREETLSMGDEWYCPQCKKHRKATKEISLWRLPPILVLHLKRFNAGSMIRNKDERDINFPIGELNLGQYMRLSEAEQTEQAVYDLYGVVHHHGTLFYGHYASYVRLMSATDPGESEIDWRYCDDSHVTEAEESETVKPFAYILFYRLRRNQDIVKDDLAISESDSDDYPGSLEYTNGQKFTTTLINNNRTDNRNIVCYTDSDDNPESLD
ncbi:DgyrCDS4355 [Dimorphilus gyrociliatus]|uniref:ubiquitinyl hydrolase 1 n=1 Tax=Dimorphilus gyrociliatus TaxID=2664684 RepID=A0A7I8VI70_9ANNE|nr:DgyrCDS4355 [Dimorphilus gyrociliatus]